MSKLFKIFGNFTYLDANLEEKWAEPDPSFVGEIVVNDLNEFVGYCDELYETTMSDLNKTRFLKGELIKNDNRYNLVFLKLSNDPEQSPLLYAIPNLENLESPNRGYWGALYLNHFCFQGQGRITIEEQPYSREDEIRIKKRFDEVDETITWNKQLLNIPIPTKITVFTLS